MIEYFFPNSGIGLFAHNNLVISASDELGRNGFQLAEEEQLDIITGLIRRKMPSIAIKGGKILKKIVLFSILFHPLRKKIFASIFDISKHKVQNDENFIR